MHEAQNWRELLGMLIHDPDQRQQIAAAIGINPVTLQRWVTGKYAPRQEHLQQLLNALPQHRQQLSTLLKTEFPDFVDVEEKSNRETTTIPSSFYARVLDLYTATPPLEREIMLSNLILQQLIQRLDTPQQGMVAALARCVQPIGQQQIRSLRITAIKVTPPWSVDPALQTQFFGAESQTGHALLSRHPIIIHKGHNKDRLFPYHAMPQEESSVTFPILMGDRAAGCLCLASTRPNHFHDSIDLLQSYVELLVLAFEPHTFYDLNTIQLGVMPIRAEQQAYLDSYPERLLHYLNTTEAGQPISPARAEQLAWHDIEEALLKHQH